MCKLFSLHTVYISAQLTLLGSVDVVQITSPEHSLFVACCSKQSHVSFSAAGESQTEYNGDDFINNRLSHVIIHSTSWHELIMCGKITLYEKKQKQIHISHYWVLQILTLPWSDKIETALHVLWYKRNKKLQVILNQFFHSIMTLSFSQYVIFFSSKITWNNVNGISAIPTMCPFHRFLHYVSLGSCPSLQHQANYSYN